MHETFKPDGGWAGGPFNLDTTVGYPVKTKFSLEELAAFGCIGWAEFSSSIFNARFNQIQEDH